MAGLNICVKIGRTDACVGQLIEIRGELCLCLTHMVDVNAHSHTWATGIKKRSLEKQLPLVVYPSQLQRGWINVTKGQAENWLDSFWASASL